MRRVTLERSRDRVRVANLREGAHRYHFLFFCSPEDSFGYVNRWRDGDRLSLDKILTDIRHTLISLYFHVRLNGKARVGRGEMDAGYMQSLSRKMDGVYYPSDNDCITARYPEKRSRMNAIKHF